MLELKPITPDGIPAALERARTYRLLNEPQEAESICRDVLHIDRENQDALVMMLLALTEMFGQGLQVNIGHAQEILPRLRDDYAKVYFSGIIYERWAKVQLEEGAPGYVVYDWYMQAIGCYEEAERVAPAGQDDPRLRHNACVRAIKRNPALCPRPEDRATMDAILQDDVPV